MKIIIFSQLNIHGPCEVGQAQVKIMHKDFLKKVTHNGRMREQGLYPVNRGIKYHLT